MWEELPAVTPLVPVAVEMVCCACASQSIRGAAAKEMTQCVTVGGVLKAGEQLVTEVGFIAGFW